MHACMVYTELAPRRQQFHVAPAMQQQNSTVITSLEIQRAMCKATVTHSESRKTGEQQICSETDNSAVATIVKHLGFISRGEKFSYQ